jgi:MYXO-CTERM domain-containing protein
MQRFSELKSFKVIIFAITAVIVYLASPASVRAEAPPSESYSPPPEATEKAYNPPKQEIGTVQSSPHSNLGWLGLIGLVGLAGLIRRK